MKRFFEGAAITFAIGFVLFLIWLLVTSWPTKAHAAEPVVTPIDSCLDGWFWKAGTGEKETPPSLTPDGLFWNDNDTVNAVIAWHFVEATPTDAQVTGDKWSMVDFAAAGPGSPGPNTAFKFLTSPWTGTWNYMGDGNWWKSAGGPPDINAAGTYNNTQMVEGLGFAGAQVAAFGIGTETSSVDQPGFVIERVFFAGEAYSLKCEPEVVVSTVPGPVVTVIKTVTPSPSVSVPVTTSPAVTVSPTVSRTAARATEAAFGSSGDGTGMPWTAVAVGAAALVAAGSTVAAVAAARRRRQDENADSDDELDDDQTAVIPYVDNGDAETPQQ